MNRSTVFAFSLGGITALLGMLVFQRFELPGVRAEAAPTTATPEREYDNRLTPIPDPKPLLADFPEYVEPVNDLKRFESARLVDDADANLDVRAWRWSYNAGGIIEMPNRLDSKHTAVIMVHPWAIDDEWGWRSPRPNGIADFCTIDKNKLAYRHTQKVIDPFIKRLRDQVSVVMYSLPGLADPIRTKVYRSFDKTPTAEERAEGEKELRAKLASYPYKGEPLPQKLGLSKNTPVIDYFKQFPGIDATARYNGDGFWKLPIPVSTSLTIDPRDVVIFDQEGYAPLRAFLKKQGVKHVLLTGYATDMCFCRTTAGYENLSRDFNVFLVGDATLSTFPANSTPRFATNAHISYASLNQLVTQVNWVRLLK